MMDRVCRDCGDLFTITEQEGQFFEHKGLQLPKRCQGCRAARKVAEIDEEQAAGSSTPWWAR